VTVAITMQGGKLIAIDTPKYPDSPPSQYARSRLIAQALAAGSANIQGVSGATYTSLAFTRSLESALTQVKSAPQSMNSAPSTTSVTPTPVTVVIPGGGRYEDD
jgi:hypothetical protein